MGLGAGFKFVDKDKDKDWDKDKEKAREKHKDQKDKDDPSGRRKIPEDEVAGHSHTAHSHAGWTSMVEESLCYIDIPATGASSSFVSNFGMGHPPDSADPHRNPNVEQRKGPYQLLVKERMMGIYLAAYINRDIRHLVKGIFHLQLPLYQSQCDFSSDRYIQVRSYCWLDWRTGRK